MMESADLKKHEVVWRWHISDGPRALAVEAECACGGFWLYPDLGMKTLVEQVGEHQGLTWSESKAALRHLLERDIWGFLVEKLDWEE